jgi:predicted nucleotidyltransferase
MKTLEEIKEILKEHKEEVSRKYKVSEIGIFGSFVRGDQKKRSDIDVLGDMDFSEFLNDDKTKSAIVWKIGIIGEATKNVPLK